MQNFKPLLIRLLGEIDPEFNPDSETFREFMRKDNELWEPLASLATATHEIQELWKQHRAYSEVELPSEETTQLSESSDPLVESEDPESADTSDDNLKSENRDLPEDISEEDTGSSELPEEIHIPEEEPLTTEDLLMRSKISLKKNAMVGQAYEYDLDLDMLTEAYGIQDIMLSGLEEIGLNYDPETGIISGIPSEGSDGTHMLTLQCREVGDESGTVYEKEVPLIINPNPRSLWQDLPQPADAPYQNEPECSQRITGPNRTLIAASKRGRSHAHSGAFRDDAFAVEYTKTGWYVIAVSDGAGSAPYSRKGAEIACNSSMEVVKKELKKAELEDKLDIMINNYVSAKQDIYKDRLQASIQQILFSAVTESYKAISKEASQQTDSRVKDFAATLLLTICKSFDFGYFVASFWIGDGGIAVYIDGAEQPVLLGMPDGGEFAGQTYFLTMWDELNPTKLTKRLHMAVVPEDFTMLAVMTDGISDPVFETDAGLASQEKWESFWQNMSETVTFERGNPDADRQLLEWLDFWSVGNHDDRTLALLF